MSPRSATKAKRSWLLALVAASIVSSRAVPAWAQFDPMSSGVDGYLGTCPIGSTLPCLDLAWIDTSAGEVEVIFSPDAFVPPLAARDNGVYEFVSIEIPAGIRLLLRANTAGLAPMHWLAQGDVRIDGVVDLSGEAGHAADPNVARVRSIPGPGGFPGGWGAVAGGLPKLGGAGPGFNANADGLGFLGCGAGHKNLGSHPVCGSTYGNQFLRPLIGGSGAKGGGSSTVNGSGGGAGGGAILIASATSVLVNGRITTRGGGASPTLDAVGLGGPGSGGAIRLVAPVVGGVGDLDVRGGLQPSRFGDIRGGSGWARIEATTNSFVGTVTDDGAAALKRVTLAPNSRILPEFDFALGGFPTLRIASFTYDDPDDNPDAGLITKQVPLEPSGRFNPEADVKIDAEDVADNVTIRVEGRNVPVGTPVTITVANEDDSSPDISATLEGTEEDPFLTATVKIPPGFSVVSARASFTVNP